MSLLLLFQGAPAPGLQGAIAAQSNVTGALTVTAALQAVTAAQSTVTGTLTNTPVGQNPLVGRIDAQSDVAGTIKVLRPLQGVITAQSSMTWAQPVAAGGKFVLTKARIVLGGVDISRFCNTVEMQLSTEEIDTTPLGSPYHDRMHGATTGQFTLSLFADPAVLTPSFWASLDTPTQIQITPRSDLPTARQNPTWTGDTIAIRKTPLTGQPGEAATASVELHSTGPVLQVES